MPTLSDTQAIVLTTAAQRAGGNLLPLPGSLRGGAAAKVVAALLSRGLVEERTVDTTAKADAALNTLWRNLDDGRGVLLRITPAGLEALGIEADSAAEAATEAEYADELRKPEVEPKKADPKLTRLVTRIIDARTEKWSDDLVNDPVQANLEKIIAGKKKASHHPIKAKPKETPAATTGNVVSIMDALKRSLETDKKRR